MSREKQAALALYSGGGASPRPVVREDIPRARVGLSVELQTMAPGVVELAPLPDHLLKVHAGAPTHGNCSFHRFVYTRGDVDLCPAGMSDVWEHTDASTSVVVRLSPTLLRRAAEDMGMDPDRAGLEPRHQFKDPQIEHIAWALDADRQAGHPGGLLYTESLGLALSIHLLGRYPAPLERVRGLSPAQQRRLTDYIEDHLDKDLSLVRLAGVVGVSASHLKTLFKRTMGVPVHEYVIQRRVERARTLLLRGRLPAGQVALEAGFSHQSHMARCMKRVLGVTPSALVRGPRA
ncbi:helix-turn-helix transcriptional regulator [Pyxidicoccus fallax]|uniref:Helix-turn-helix transcriptional regulator n=1 Tax=Pyxidicoccus fallax TaxID=394095 RepID=A0A848LF73_9BACT|nr:AraC family transcriptional regulator [Pyxidicoccus fallax]NMO17084.1 helix-turn-helix transcriptional regulator [Pyxidicoccus fallax]NPC78866.1 helix-turn-helix transcriptional regulator [Pyxidicoccus fallax]